VARWSWLLITQVALVGTLVAVAFASDGSAYVDTASVSLTASGPAPTTLKMRAGTYLAFVNKDSVPHTVVFANGLCSLAVSPGEAVGPGISINGSQQPDCNRNFPFYVGSYAYTVDGKFPGRVDTMPGRRSVSLTARTYRIHRGERLTLHGQVIWDNTATPLTSNVPFPVIVLARYEKQPFQRIATVAIRRGDQGWFWRLHVRPGVQTSYVAVLKGQLPEGPIWQQARSRLFTVRMRR
jgi:plastocyanin